MTGSVPVTFRFRSFYPTQESPRTVYILYVIALKYVVWLSYTSCMHFAWGITREAHQLHAHACTPDYTQIT